jgi:methylmalonyl-CoA mutase
MDKKKKLFEQFPPVSTQQWMDKINADLKGADFNKKLVWKTRDGLPVMPFYRQEDLDNLPHTTLLPGDFPFVRGLQTGGNNWYIRQDVTVTDYTAANGRALDILMRGITSLGFIITDPESVTPETIAQLLKGIHPESIELNFSIAGRAKELLAALQAHLGTAGTDLNQVNIIVSADPLGRLAANGKLCVPVEQGLDYLADLVREAEATPGIKCIEPAGTLFSNAGAGPVAELAYILSLGNEYMTALTERGIRPEMAARAMRFTFGIGPDFFPEIAKLRAARMLWAEIVKAWCEDEESKSQLQGDEAALMHIHAVTGRWNKTLYDPYVNMLRTQTEAMSAVLGGAESVTVEPFDAVFRSAEDFSERIARNQQLLLMEEAHLGRVADPGAGSYYIEELTAMTAREAWKIFLETENEGGFLEALRKGIIQKSITEAAATRKADMARRKEVLLGTNQYPDFREKKAPQHDPGKLFAEYRPSQDEVVKPIIPSRGAVEFEKLRLATEKSGRRPLVFMLTIGDPAMRRARAQFSSNFFAVAGYEVKDNNGFETIAEGVNAALEAKADIITICSSDDEYAILAKEAFTAIAGKAVFVVAGNPPCTDELKAAGVENFISIRSNVLETLQMFNRKLGIN